MSLHVTRPAPSSTARVRLKGRSERRGTRTGMSGLGGFAFGAVFVAAGGLIVLVGTGIMAVDPATVHAPYWVLTVAGTVFMIGGLLVWRMAWAEARQAARRARVRPDDPHRRLLTDYPWTPEGFTAPRWQKVGPALSGAAFVTLFLSIFNYWAFFMDGPWMVKGIVILFDLLAVLAWLETLRRILHAAKFGVSRVRFERFPYAPTGPVALDWQPGTGVTRATRGTFVLRCVEEWIEVRRSGKKRSQSLVHEAVYVDTLAFDQPYEFGPGEPVRLTFEIPPGAPGTRLSAEKPVFWELEVRLDLSGLDFQETYLVPVYDAAEPV